VLDIAGGIVICGGVRGGKPFSNILSQLAFFRFFSIYIDDQESRVDYMTTLCAPSRTTFTLSSTLRVVFKTSAVAIRASSSVSESSLFSESSILFFPSSLFKYFSGANVSEGRKIKKEQPTRSFLFNLLCHDPEDRQYLNHDFDDNVSHSCGRCDCSVRLEAPEEIFDSFEQVNEHISARFDVLCRLTNAIVTMASTRKSKPMLTKRRTPIPAKITFAGEDT
jgi:hypothetical protein